MDNQEISQLSQKMAEGLGTDEGIVILRCIQDPENPGSSRMIWDAHIGKMDFTHRMMMISSLADALGLTMKARKLVGLGLMNPDSPFNDYLKKHKGGETHGTGHQDTPGTGWDVP